MSEGEFEKRFSEFKKIWIDQIHIDEVEKWIDEARKDFPLAYHDLERLKNDLKTDWFSMTGDGAIKIIDWFVKWFGDRD